MRKDAVVERERVRRPRIEGEAIGLEPIDDGVWRVWFYAYPLGRFDERQGPTPWDPKPLSHVPEWF